MREGDDADLVFANHVDNQIGKASHRRPPNPERGIRAIDRAKRERRFRDNGQLCFRCTLRMDSSFDDR